MDVNNPLLSNGAYKTSSTNEFAMMYPIPDENEDDVLNDETFGDCDLTKITIKSDFGANGEFLGDDTGGDLPDFFDTDLPESNQETSLYDDASDQAQSIDALLGEDPMRISIRQQSTQHPLFNMAISQARNESIFPTQLPPPPPPPPPPRPQPPPPQQQQMNMQLLRQFEQLLISRQVPPQERMLYMQAMFEKMHPQQQQQQQHHPPPPPMPNANLNNHPPKPPTASLLEQARLAPMEPPPSTGISSQFLDAIQRSDQIPAQPSSPPVESMSNHRHNRPTRHYPRPPMLNTWQGRGPKHDEFAGLMSDREKQWVVKIQLHQVSQTQEEDYYFHKWSQQKHRTNQLNRHDHRGQKISYPVLQLLKSIQQEKELADRLSQQSAQAVFSNVTPLPYASPLHTQLGKQSTATPKHPRCTLHLDGQFILGTQANAITHNKYHLGLLLHIENLYRDVQQLESDNSKELLQSILRGYFTDENYFFPDLFGGSRKGQLIFERLYRYLISNSPEHLEFMFTRLYSSLTYMTRRYTTHFSIEPAVMNMINLLQQQISAKKTTLEQILAQIYQHYNEQIKPKILQFDSTASSSPFSDSVLFNNSHIITILFDLLLSLERQCYLLSHATSSPLPKHVVSQQAEYQLSEYVRLFVADFCQALINCSVTKKLLKPFATVHQQQFNLLCRFLRTQIPQEIYTTLEPKLISCCVKET